MRDRVEQRVAFELMSPADPLDFKQAGMIVDDDLHDILVKPLPAGCRLTAIFDSARLSSLRPAQRSPR